MIIITEDPWTDPATDIWNRVTMVQEQTDAVPISVTGGQTTAPRLRRPIHMMWMNKQNS